MSDFLGVADTTLEERGGWWVRRGLSAHDFHTVNTAFSMDEYDLDNLLPRDERCWVLDLGGYIGAFSRKVHHINPLAKIVIVEADAANVPAIVANCPFAEKVYHAACDYRPNVALCSSIFNNTSAPSNSSVFPTEEVAAYHGTNWVPHPEPLATVTLEKLIEAHGIDRVACCKIDVEGSEFNILAQSTSLDAIDCIVGEYHSTGAKFMDLLDQHCPPSKWWRRLYNKHAHQGNFCLLARGTR